MSLDPSPALLPLAVVIPLTGAVLSGLLGRFSGRLGLTISVVAMVATSVLLAAFVPQVYGGQVAVEHIGGWSPEHGTQLGVTFAADALGLTFALLCAVLGGVLLLFTESELDELGRHETAGYAALFQLLLAGLIGSALTADVLDLFVWFEVAALASYGLTAFFLERPLALEAGFKIMVLTNMAAFYLFLGIGVVYAGHGALNFGQVAASLRAHLTTADVVALGLMIAAFGTKAGLMPFHGWLPDAHSVAPGPVSALFSGLMVNLGLLGLLRVVVDVYGKQPHAALDLLLVLGPVAAVAGGALALVQDDLKRLLGYDTISQMGVLVTALGVDTHESLTGLVYHLINHALFKSLLFLCAGAIVHATGMTKLSQMGGLARRRPVVAVAFTAGALAISGVPPLNGYVSVGLVHQSVEHGHVVLLVALTIAQVFTVAALGRATYLAFFRRREAEYERFERPHPGMVVSFLLLIAGCIGFGVAPTFVLRDVVGPAVASLTQAPTYVALTLGPAGTVGRLEPVSVQFSYFEPQHLVVLVATLVVGGLLARWAVRHPDPRSVRWLRALHTGSVNDYTAYAVIGLVVAVGALVIS